jgi:hypothetical protein
MASTSPSARLSGGATLRRNVAAIDQHQMHLLLGQAVPFHQLANRGVGRNVQRHLVGVLFRRGQVVRERGKQFEGDVHARTIP